LAPLPAAVPLVRPQSVALAAGSACGYREARQLDKLFNKRSNVASRLQEAVTPLTVDGVGSAVMRTLE
jgi:hypothetical protein